eukprot:360913-Chlamydomonas_euryale.AAC.3
MAWLHKLHLIGQTSATSACALYCRASTSRTDIQVAVACVTRHVVWQVERGGVAVGCVVRRPWNTRRSGISADGVRRGVDCTDDMVVAVCDVDHPIVIAHLRLHGKGHRKGLLLRCQRQQARRRGQQRGAYTSPLTPYGVSNAALAAAPSE